MTFTEAAVEVLRRAGKPLHFNSIAELAIRDQLLSHVGQDPEVTMGQRLAAMAKREDDRKVVAVAPEGTFALLEWGVPQEQIVEAVAPPLSPPESPDPQYRPREREPRAIHAQARKRLQELQAEHEPNSVLLEEQEKEKKELAQAASDDRQRRGAQRGQRRFPPPAEVVFEWLAQRQSGATLAEMAEGLLEKGLLSDALVRDLPSMTAALLEDNRRRTEAGRKPAFIVDGERITLVEFPPPTAIHEAREGARSPHSSLGRPPTGAQLLVEGRRAVVRALRSRTADMDTAAFEHLCSAMLEKMGMRDVRVAKRGKEGPLYLARQRRGVSDLRVAVRLVRGQREISRADVQELRKDLAHYSAQMGLVLTPGEAGREARAEASAAGQPPIALYAGDALAEEMVAVRVGVSVQMVELVDVDEAFFATALRAPPAREEAQGGREPRRRDQSALPPPRVESADGPAQSQAAEETPAEAVAVAEADLVAAAREPAPAVESAPQEVAANVSPAAEPAPTSEAAAPVDPESDEARRDGRGRGRGRGTGERDREPRRPALPSEQAWGQPAGTPRRPGVPFAPTVALDPNVAPPPDAPAAAVEASALSTPPPEPPAAPEPSSAASEPPIPQPLAATEPPGTL